MKHRLRNSETVHQRHAAQIYAEMLGLVCHKQLYECNIEGFQEVNPLPRSWLISGICTSREACNVLYILCQI